MKFKVKYNNFHSRKLISKCHLQFVSVCLNVQKLARDASGFCLIWSITAGIILCTHPANEWQCYNVTLSLIGWGVHKIIPVNVTHTPLDSFTVPMHSPNGRRLPAVGAVQGDCHWGLENGANSHWSHESIMQWGTRQSQSIFRPTNH